MIEERTILVYRLDVRSVPHVRTRIDHDVLAASEAIDELERGKGIAADRLSRIFERGGGQERALGDQFYFTLPSTPGALTKP